MKSVRNLLLVLVTVLVTLGTALGQTSNGTLVGTITDDSGAAIVGATITASSIETGAARTTLSGQDGTYRVESLLPGTYRLSVTAPGFSEGVVEGLLIPSSATISSSLQLKIGNVANKVEITAVNDQLNTDNGQISGTISTQEIENLPIASLNPYELALTLPGVLNVTQGGFSNGVNYNVGGGRPRANNFLIEGQDNNDAGIQGQGLQPGNDEAVAEVTIIENAYTAEYGHGAGSVANLTYKSGTNKFHGSVFERLQNSSLDTSDKQDHIFQVNTKTLYRENMPGFSIGGPIVRNKAFFFASYQWDYYRSTANLSNLVIPTAKGMAVLNAQPSNDRLNNLIKAWGGLVGVVNPNDLQPSIPLGPDPNTGADRGTVEMGLVRRNLGADSDAPELDLKGQYNPSDRDQLTLRFIRTRFTAPYDVFNFTGQLPGFDSDQDGTSYNSGIVETHQFNPRVVNEFRLSYSRIGFAFGLPASTTSNPLYDQPAVSVTNLTGYGIPGNIPQGRFHNTYQLQDTVSWTKGRHFFKVGTDIADIRVRDQIPFNFYGAIGFAKDKSATDFTIGETDYSAVYSGLANLIDDFGGPSSTVTQNFGSPIARPRLISQNYFAEDTFRPLPNLTLDMGFRYEYNGAPFNASGTPYPGIDFNNIACFPQPNANPPVVCNTKQQADGSQWGPRAGITYSPKFLSQRATVVRAGFGVFYDVVFTNIIDNIQATAPNAASPQITSVSTANNNRGHSDWYEQFANLNHNPRPTNTAEPIADHLLAPRTLHWNLNVQQELPWQTTLQVGYVGERGEHLYSNENLNPYIEDLFSAERVIPTRGAIVVRDNSEDSNYAGLWTELDHKFNHDFLFRASYTYGRSFDNGSEIFTTNNESSYPSSRFGTNRGSTDYGPSEYDHRQRLVLTYIWQPRTWHTEGAMKIVGNTVNHWSLAGVTQFQSGSPENVEVGYDTDGDGISNDRPQVSNPKAPLTTYAWDDSWFYGVSDGGLCSGPAFWYTSLPCEPVSPSDVHWIVPAYGTRPSSVVSRNSRYSKGIQQWDVNIQRSFQLHEGWNLDFRGEMFNIFNHDLPGIENTTLTSGINSDNFIDNGSNTFGDTDLTHYGHRHARLFIRIRF